MTERGFRIKSKAALMSALIANAASQSFLLVVWPLLGRRLGLTDIQTGALLSISALLLLPSAPIWGFASEKIGRRLVLLIALSGCLMSPLGFAIIGGWRLDGLISPGLTFGLLLIIRIGQSIVSGGLLPASQAWLGDITSPEERVRHMGLLGASHGFGAVVGTAIAWRFAGSVITVFWFFSAVVAAGTLATAVFLKNSQPRATAESKVPVDWAALLPFFLVTTVGISIFSLTKQVTGLYLQDVLGFTPQEAMAKTGQIITASSLAMVAMQGLGLRAIPWAKEKLILAGGLLVLVSAVMLVTADDWREVLAALIGLGLAFGLMLPGNLASLSLKAGPLAQGRAAGANALGQGLGMSIGPMLGAGLFHLKPSAPFVAVIIAGIVLSGLALFIIGRKNDKAD